MEKEFQMEQSEMSPADMKIRARELFEHFPNVPLVGYFEAAAIDDNGLNPESENVKVLDKENEIVIITPNGEKHRGTNILHNANRLTQSGIEKRTRRSSFRQQTLINFQALLTQSELTSHGIKYASRLAESIYNLGMRDSEVGVNLRRTFELYDEDSVGPFDPESAERIDTRLYIQYQSGVIINLFGNSTIASNKKEQDEMREWRRSHFALFGQRI